MFDFVAGKDLEETERQYGDDYVIMAAHLLIDLHKETSKEPLENNIRILLLKCPCAHLIDSYVDLATFLESYFPLLNATFMLEHALSASKHNYQMKLVLIRVYELLGMLSCLHLFWHLLVIHDTVII